MKRLILFIMHTKFYRWLLRHVIPRIRFSTSYGGITGAQYLEIQSLLCAGDVIQVSDPWKLTGLLIKGWDHSEFVVSETNYSWTIGFHAEGMRQSYLFDVLKECKHVRVLRHKDDKQRSNAVELAHKLIKRNAESPIPYDTFFQLGAEALYCHELIMHLYSDTKFDTSDEAGLGVPYLSAKGIAENPMFEIIYDSTRGDV